MPYSNKKIRISYEARSYAIGMTRIAILENTKNIMLFVSIVCAINSIYYIFLGLVIPAAIFIVLAALELGIFFRANNLIKEAWVEMEENYELD